MKINRRKIIWGTLVLVAIACLYLIIIIGYWFYGRDIIYPGVSVAGISVSGMKSEEAQSLLEEVTEDYLGQDIKVGESELAPEDIELRFNIEESVRRAIKEFSENPFLLGSSVDYPLEIQFEEEALYEYVYSLEENYSEAPQNPEAKLDKGELLVVEGKSGQQINYSDTFKNITQALGSLSSDVAVSLLKIEPTYSSSDLEGRREEIEVLLSSELVLVAHGDMIDLSPDDLVSWVDLGSQKNSYARLFEGDRLLDPVVDARIGNQLLSQAKIENYLGSLAGELNSSPVNAELSIVGGRAVVFVESKNGLSLDIAESAQGVAQALEDGSPEYELLFIEVEPEIHTGSLNNLGIKELIATGYSNFSGSPSNRRHNIRVGAERFNGILLKPDEIFSFTGNLGEVDAANGYLPELVIKNNETTPEYGGGLCQVSSTAFRAALNAGLPITSRKAHSYPVTYYKPYGTDATIYVPNPDLRFKNDTEGHILIQTRIVGNYLYFDFYGTKKETSVSFAGNKNASGAVSKVEWVTPYTYDHGGRGAGSFKAIIYRFIRDSKNNLIDSEYFYSNYDSPDKYPH